MENKYLCNQPVQAGAAADLTSGCLVLTSNIPDSTRAVDISSIHSGHPQAPKVIPMEAHGAPPYLQGHWLDTHRSAARLSFSSVIKVSALAIPLISVCQSTDPSCGLSAVMKPTPPEHRSHRKMSQSLAPWSHMTESTGILTLSREVGIGRPI